MPAMLDGLEVCDIHHHLGGLTGGSLQSGQGWMDKDYETRVAMMEENHIDFVGIQAATGYLQPDGIKATMRSNDTVAAYRKRDPKRFPIGAGIVEPLHGEASLPELERIKYELGLQGVVWHHRFQGVSVDHQFMRPILKKVQALGLVAFVHANGESNQEAAWRLEKVAHAFPDIHFVGMDALCTNAAGQMALEIAKRTPNITWDCSHARSSQFLRRFVDEAGSDKLVVGSTYYSSPPSYTKDHALEQVLEAGLRREDLANVLALNVKRLFGLS
jgi:predicted TIM-barrel fold metal-dependent hydrolase